MIRIKHQALALTSLSLGLLTVAPTLAAQLQRVDPNTWGRNGVPTYIDMHIYVPDQLATNPPILVASHSCGTGVDGYFNDATVRLVVAAADRNGFIMIFPALDVAGGRNCWDVGSDQGLTRDGGGDPHAIAKMVQYTLSQYSANQERIYAMGGSSGAMMTQALMALYPDVFKAGSARAGVPAGCWAEGYVASNQWGENCSNGGTTKTAEQWGDIVRSKYPGYDGPRPRVQLFHGTSDTTIAYHNMAEATKQWTNVLGLSTDPTSTVNGFQGAVSTYDKELWEDQCGYVVLEAWHGAGTHSMGYESEAIVEFFGLNDVDGPDPYEAACGGNNGTGGQGGAGGSGNTGGGPSQAGAGGLPPTGASTCVQGINTGSACDLAVDSEPCALSLLDCVCGSDSQWSCTPNNAGTGGSSATGGAENTGGANSAGGSDNTGNSSGLGGSPASGGALAAGGAPASGGASSSLVAPGAGGTVSGGQPGVGGAPGSMGFGGTTATGAGQMGGSSAVTGGTASGGFADGQSPSATSASGDDGGCGCRVSSSHGQRGSMGAAFALLAGIALGMRRRQRPSRAQGRAGQARR